MVERIGISEADLRSLEDLLDPARAGEPGEHVPESLLQELPNVMGCDDAKYSAWDPYSRLGSLQVSDGDGIDPYEALSWPAFWEGFCYPQISGDWISVTRSTDRLPGVRRGPKVAAYLEASPGKYGLTMPLPPVGLTDHRLILTRNSGSDFTDRDVLLFSFLRPHVVALCQAHHALRIGVPDLTPRQWEVVQAMAAGYGNADIARGLFLSEGTVRKHLENIYSRLGVSSRTEALAKTRHLSSDAGQIRKLTTASLKTEVRSRN